MGWSIRVTLRSGRNATDELLMILDMQVARGILLSLNKAPVEELVIEPSGGGGIGSTQIGPAHRTVLVRNAHAFVLFGLPDGKNSSGWIGNNGHAADIHHVEGRSTEFTSDFG